MAEMESKFQFSLLAIFGLTSLVGWFFALPGELRTFLLIFFGLFVSLVVFAKWTINGWRGLFRRDAD